MTTTAGIGALTQPGLRAVKGGTTMHRETRAPEQKHAERRMKRAGYKVGGAVHRDADEAQDAAMVKKGIRQHEAHDHKGEKPTKLKLRAGGHVEGDKARHRIDRRARGGALPGKKGGNINIILKTGEPAAQKQLAAQQGLKQGMQMGAALGARQAAGAMQRMTQRPPMPPGAAPGQLPTAPPGGPPNPGMPQAAGALATGGMVKVREHTRRKAGGAV